MKGRISEDINFKVPFFKRTKLQSPLFRKIETFCNFDQKIERLSACLSACLTFNFLIKVAKNFQSSDQICKKKQKNLDLLNRPFDPSQNVEWFRFTKLVFLWKMKRTLNASNLIFLKSIPESLQCSSLPIKLSRRPLRNLDCNVSQTKKFSNPF